MKNSSDKMFEKFKDYDFADAKPVAKISVLEKLQAEVAAKHRYKLEDMLTEMPGKLPRDEGWDAMRPVGKEVL